MDNNNIMEEWKIIPNFSNYSASNLGRIKNNKTNRILDMHKSPDGYMMLSIKNDQGKNKSSRAHRLVAQTWIPNPENKPTINHINKIKDDNRVINLEWATAIEQSTHKFEFDKVNKIENKLATKSIWMCNLETKERIKQYKSINKAAIELKNMGKGTTLKTICAGLGECINGRAKSAYGFFWDDY